ncbi:MAG TPA: glycosyltransferase family 2 protein [Acidobacteriaceae bacterium]|jgi:GT2 family glycosyltransferase
MDSAHVIVLVLAWLMAAAWVYKLLEAAWGLSTVPNLLAPEYDVTPASPPSLTVIVPARDEQANIAACLESLLAQDVTNLHILAVDDRSSDQTGVIMDTLARAHPDRLEVLHVTNLPAGWLGKTHAMALAARHAIATHNPEYLLFTDGDILFRRDAIRRALAGAAATQADHFVVLPTTLVKTHGEGMLMSYIQTMSLWAVRPWRVPDPSAKRDAIGVGAFNLIRTQAYQQLGGFDATPMEVLEDLTLGRRVKRAGLRQRVAYAPGLVCVHWAAGAFGIVHGMTKNLFAVFRFRPAMLLAAAVSVAAVTAGTVGLVFVHATRIPALIMLGSIAGLYFLSSRTSRISPAYFVLFPIGASLVVYSMLRSMLLTVLRGGVVWRGTFYPLDELRKHTQ